MITKQCPKCKIVKSIEEFNIRKNTGRPRGPCKQCEALSAQEWRANNPEYHQNWETKNKVKRKEQKRIYWIENRELCVETRQIWLNNNPNYHTLYKRKKRLNIKEKLKNNLRSRLHTAIKRKQKSGSFIKDLGCSIEYLIIHLESRFELGMTWDNYGKSKNDGKTWEIDHIKPLSLFNLEDREDFLQASHYTNLQPLWKIDNIRKSNKYTEENIYANNAS